VQLKTILNHVERHKSFVYQEARWADAKTKTTIEIPIEPRANGQAICSGCGKGAPGYDRLAERRFEFVPLWQIAVYFVYAMRRVDCVRCGVRVERVPWCDGKHSLTTTYRWFLAGWAKRLSWKGVAEAFGTTWQNVFRSVNHAVSWGLSHRDLNGIASIGVDEIQWQRGHKYLTLVYPIDAGTKRLTADGYEPVLKHSRWCLLKRRANLTEKQAVQLSELLKYNLQSVRSHLLREDFQRFWEYVSPGWAARFLDQWCIRTMRSKIEPMKKIARTLRNHRELILNWFRAKGAISAGTVEGLNNKVKLTTRKSYGFRTYEAIEISHYHNLGRLPEPEFTHRFW
jgi:transposase